MDLNCDLNPGMGVSCKGLNLRLRVKCECGADAHGSSTFMLCTTVMLCYVELSLGIGIRI